MVESQALVEQEGRRGKSGGNRHFSLVLLNIYLYIALMQTLVSIIKEHKELGGPSSSFLLLETLLPKSRDCE